MAVMRRKLPCVGMNLPCLPWLFVARFIDEVLEILVENQITVMKDLNKFKFEYMTWPVNVKGMWHVLSCIYGVDLLFVFS